MEENTVSRRKGPDTTATSVRLPNDLLARLEEFCDRRVVGRNLVICKAIENLLDDLAPDPLRQERTHE